MSKAADAGTRILFVIDSLARGGAEVSLVNMAPSYRDQRLELHVAFLKDRQDLAAGLAAAGAQLHPVELGGTRPRQLRALVTLVRRLRPDVIHTTLWEADVLGRLAGMLTGTPVVSTLPTSDERPSVLANPGVHPAKLRLARWIDIATARGVVRFHAVSETVAERMSVALRVRRDRVTVIPRARRRDLLGEPSPERRLRVRRELGFGDRVPLVLAVARHEHQKGLDVLLAAVPTIREAVPEVVVLVAGRQGRMTNALQRGIDAAGLGERFCCLGERSDVPDLLVASDVVAVPSRLEGLPGAVLEAMALVRPVVASDLPVVREAIGPHAYALVPVGDARALADAIIRCLGDPSAGEAALAARARFDELFSTASVAERLRAFYGDAQARSAWNKLPKFGGAHGGGPR